MRTARGRDVYGQFLANDGTLLNADGTPVAGSTVNIPPVAGGWQSDITTLAYNGRQNEYLLVWQDGREMGSLGWEVYAQRYVAGAIGPTSTVTQTPSPTPTVTPTPTYSCAHCDAVTNGHADAHPPVPSCCKGQLPWGVCCRICRNIYLPIMHGGWETGD